MAITDAGIAAIALKDVSLIFGTAETGTEYKKTVSGVTFTPTTNDIEWRGLGGVTLKDSDPATWDANIEFIQDWVSPGSLCRYLYEHEGETQTIAFEPKSGAGPTFTATVTIRPATIGGGIGSFPTASVTLPCQGKPVLTD